MMLPVRVQRATLLVLVALLLPFKLSATTVERLEVEDLVDRAEQIFRGTVIDTPRSLTRDGEILTRVHLQVQQSFKGNLESTVDVLLPGGIVDGVQQHITGMPTLRAGEEVVLFLSKPDRLGRRWPIGLSQAKFTVEHHAGRPATVTRQFNGLQRWSFDAARQSANGSRRPSSASQDPSRVAPKQLPTTTSTLHELLQRIENRLDPGQPR